MVIGVRSTSRIALGAAVVALGALAPAGAEAATTWLCKPGLASNTCAESQRTTTVRATGARSIATPSVPSRPKVDCFYVYPTTSDQKQPQADFQITPELKAIARNQALPYTQACRMYAPVYRQVTVQGLLNPTTVTTQMREQAYLDVRDAWRDYLARYNSGRGVILVGHSQGTLMLRRLIAQEIEPKSTVMRKIVAAHLTGGNVLVAKGKTTGGDFKSLVPCRRSTQTRCVVAYSVFNEPVPEGSRFGKASPSSWDPTADPTKMEALCTNPANLAVGGSGNLITRNSTAGFPGIIGLAIGLLGRKLPTGLTTPWVAQPDLYSARCVASNGANVLMVTSRTSAPPLKASPDATWGLHLADMNIAGGNLISLAKSQAAAWRG